MEKELLHQMLEAYRTMRHDFMNHFQVISGYLQLGQQQKAQEYTKKVTNSLENYQVLSSIGLPLLQFFFTRYLTTIGREHEDLSFEIEGNLCSWQDDDQLITLLMIDIFSLLQEDIIKKDVRCAVRFYWHYPQQIEVLLQGNTGALLKKLDVLNNPETPYWKVFELDRCRHPEGLYLLISRKD